jgi:peptide/nickel transport system substrate-binding protein
MRKSISLVVLGALLAGCSKGEGSGDGHGTMIIAQTVVGGIAFPPLVEDNGGKLVQDLVFDRLAEIGDDLNSVGDKGFTPRLAEKWAWAPDSLSVAFSINPKAKWHDGKPVTASDVRYTFRIFTDTIVASSAAPTLQNIDSVSVRDSLTAVVWFKRHTPTAFYDFAYQVPIAPEHVYGSIPSKDLRTSEAVRKPIGSGRFRFVSWEPNVRLELNADTTNYRGRAPLDRIIISGADLPSAAGQVMAGQADFVDAFPLDQAAKLDSNAFAHGVVFPQFGFIYLGFNPNSPKSKTAPHPIFSDIGVRRALSMSVDRRLMNRNVFGKLGHVATGPVPASAAYADTTLKLPPYDTTAAKTLLDSLGWRAGTDGIRVKNGHLLKFSLLVPTSSALRMKYGVLLQEALHHVGAQVDLDQVEFGAFRARLGTGDFEAVMGGSQVDPSVTGAKQNWATAGIGANGQNVLKYSNRKVDALLDSAANTMDQGKMKRYSSQAFQQIVADMPAVWLYDVVTVEAINSRIKNTAIRSDAWWATLTDWSIPADKRIDRDRLGLSQAKK